MKRKKIIGYFFLTAAIVLLQNCVVNIEARLTLNNNSDYNISVDVSSLYTVISFKIDTGKAETVNFEWPESVGSIEVTIRYYGPDIRVFQGLRVILLEGGADYILDIENYKIAENKKK